MISGDNNAGLPPSYSEATEPNEKSKLTQAENQENHNQLVVGQYVDTHYQPSPGPQHESYQFQQPAGPQHPGYKFQPPPMGAQFSSCQYHPISGNTGQQPMTVVLTQPGPAPFVISPVPPQQEWMVPAVLACFFCFWPTGIIAIIAASRARSAAANGDAIEAQAQTVRARKYVIVSIVLGIVIYVFIIIIRVIFYSSYYALWGREQMNSFMKYYYNTMIFFHKLLRKKQAYNIYLFTFIIYESKCQGFDVHLDMNLVANIVNSIKSEEFFFRSLNQLPTKFISLCFK